jgi:hypothetical protein
MCKQEHALLIIAQHSWRRVEHQFLFEMVWNSFSM